MRRAFRPLPRRAVMAAAALACVAAAGTGPSWADEPLTGEPAVDPVIAANAGLQAKLRSLKLPVSSVTESAALVSADTLRAVCVWRELTGRTANRSQPTEAERTAILATPAAQQWKAPARLAKVRFAVNMQCQTAVWLTKRKVVRVLPVSTGRGPGWTRTGLFRVYYRYPGTWQRSTLYPEPDGRPALYKPWYFDGNIAVHGTPAQLRAIPESHGCIRTNPADQDWLARRLKIGQQVWVYGNYWKSSVAPYGIKKSVKKALRVSVRSGQGARPTAAIG